jgi:hypothetical protein
MGARRLLIRSPNTLISVLRPLRVGETRPSPTALTENVREVAHGAAGDLFASPLGEPARATTVRPGTDQNRPEAQGPRDDTARPDDLAGGPGASDERAPEVAPPALYQRPSAERHPGAVGLNATDEDLARIYPRGQPGRAAPRGLSPAFPGRSVNAGSSATIRPKPAHKDGYKNGYHLEVGHHTIGNAMGIFLSMADSLSANTVYRLFFNRLRISLRPYL